MKIEAVDREDARPLCPHCANEIRTLYYRKLSGRIGRRYIYFCSACRKVLGISHRKGFWMG